MDWKEAQKEGGVVVGGGGMSRGNIRARRVAGSQSGQTGEEGEKRWRLPARRAAVSISPKSSRDNGGRGEGGGEG